MRVLITGAQGFLGCTLAAEWLSADPEVQILGIGRSARAPGFARPATRRGRLVPATFPAAQRATLASSRYAYAAVDVLDRPTLAAVAARFRPDVIVHLAARLKDDAPAAMMRVNVEGTLTVIDVAAGLPHRPRIVLGSSGAVYGIPQALPLREDTPFGPATGFYAVTRRSAEEAARLVAGREELPLIVARLFNPVGPGLDERHLPTRLAAAFVDAAERGEPAVIHTGPLDGTRDFLDARDAAAALRWLALRGVGGETYNVGSGVGTPVAALVDRLAAAAGLANRVQIVEGARRVDDVPHHVADVSRLRATGFVPRYDLDITARALVGWYRGLAATPSAADGDHASAGDRARDDGPLTVAVETRTEYPVEIRAGLLDEVPGRLRARMATDRAVIVTDPTVARLYGDRVREGLVAAGFKASTCVIAEGEPAKCREVWERLAFDLRRHQFERRSVLVCLGGALVSDVGGFVAATFMRGVPYVNVPTTLLAQHDGAIGGKVAINTPWAKNALGAFHHPAAVYCDPETLRTLDARNLAAGAAEAIKVALTGDATLFALLEANAGAVLAGSDAGVLERIVRRCAAQKIALLAPDPLEVDLRRALNLGHTLAHALETEMHYEGLLHGEAVGIGLAVATLVARARGVCPPAAVERILGLLSAYRLPPRVPAARLRAALGALADIRRIRGGALHFVMPVAIDAVRIVPEVGLDELAAALDVVATLAPEGRVELAA